MFGRNPVVYLRLIYNFEIRLSLAKRIDAKLPRIGVTAEFGEDGCTGSNIKNQEWIEVQGQARVLLLAPFSE
jgi:hypothetical protein